MTSFNVSSRSDLRLYESDNNATMITLGNQGEGFLNTCVGLLKRMIETVPSDVVFSDVVSPVAVKPINATLDFDAHGNLIFSGYIRVSLLLPLLPALANPSDPHPVFIDTTHRPPLPNHKLYSPTPSDCRISTRNQRIRHHNLLPLHPPHPLPGTVHTLQRLRSRSPLYIPRTNHLIHRPISHFRHIHFFNLVEFHNRNNVLPSPEREGPGPGPAARNAGSCYQDV